MLIENLKGAKEILKGKIILLTGAGGGIGLEAAKTFAYMGAKIIIAEIDSFKGKQAQDSINAMFKGFPVEFYEIDLSKDKQIYKMYNYIMKKYGCVDILFNNATTIAMGNVEDVPIETWDKSYLVNFRAPLLLTQLFLPNMKKRNSGIIVFVSSSGATPYMGAYEVFKTCQVELCNTLDGELDSKNIYTYSIGPGLVKTETAMQGIEIVASKMGISTDEFYAMNNDHILDVEEAGCGFAVSVIMAEKYKGQEIGSIQALLDSNLFQEVKSTNIKDNIKYNEIIPLVVKVLKIYDEQYNGWKSRNIFERQWVLRDFKKTVGLSAEQFQDDFIQLDKAISEKKNYAILSYKQNFVKLKKYFKHQYKLLQGFEKNPHKLKENSTIIIEWIDILSSIIEQIP